MPKNKLNHYTTQKGRKHKKLGMGSNEHVGEGSGTQKNLNFCIKGRTPKKIKFLCLRTCTHGVFEIKIAALICSSTFSAFIKKSACQKYIEPLDHQKRTKTQKARYRKQ